MTEVPRSDLRDVDAEISDAERAEGLRAEPRRRGGRRRARMAVPGDVLFGFTKLACADSIGAHAYNQELSERRAAAVAGFLMDEHDIDQGLLETAGCGEDRPVEPNETEDGDDNPQGRAKNRRVEIVLEA